MDFNKVAQQEYDLTKIAQPTTNMDWVRVYKQSFPPEELWSPDMLCDDVANGKKLLHITKNSAGRTLCFTLVAPFEQFIWADYIGVDKDHRSSGIGSRHVSELLKICQKHYPSSKGLFFAAESTDEPGIDPLISAIRIRRQNLWSRLGAKRTRNRGRIFTPNCVNPEAPLHIMELLWFEFPLLTPVTSNDVRSIIHKVYLDHFGFKPEMVDGMMSQFNGELADDVSQRPL